MHNVSNMEKKMSEMKAIKYISDSIYPTENFSTHSWKIKDN